MYLSLLESILLKGSDLVLLLKSGAKKEFVEYLVNEWKSGQFFKMGMIIIYITDDSQRFYQITWSRFYSQLMEESLDLRKSFKLYMFLLLIFVCVCGGEVMYIKKIIIFKILVSSLTLPSVLSTSNQVHS